MWSGSAARRSSPMGRVRPKDLLTTPSWSRTGTPSAVTQTSLSEPGSAQFQGQFEAGQGVLGSVRTGSTVAECDGMFEERRESLLHPRMMAWSGYEARSSS
jgi:hypothetical protein